MYNKDIVALESTARFIIYADDTIIFISGGSCDLALRAQNMLKKLEACTDAYSLAVNVAKSKIVFFRPKRTISAVSDHLYCKARRIEIVKSFRSLSIIFSEHMQWDEHICYVEYK